MSTIFGSTSPHPDIEWRTAPAPSAKPTIEYLQNPTWEAVVEIEPGLLSLAARVPSMRLPQDHVDFWRRWESIKRQLSQLAGWEARNPRLRTHEVYGVVYDHLLDIFYGSRES